MNKMTKMTIHFRQIIDRKDGKSEYNKTHTFPIEHKSDSAASFLFDLLVSANEDGEAFTRFEIRDEDGELIIKGNYL